MTKTIVIGAPEAPAKQPKPIEFVLYLNGVEIKTGARNKPTDFQYIELVCKNYNDGSYDLIFAYDNSQDRRKGSVLYLGFWNDGVAE